MNKEFKYKTRFETIAKVVLNNEEKKEYLALASLDNLKTIFGDDSDKINSYDLLPIVGNLFIGGIVNKNDDCIIAEKGEWTKK